MNSAIRTFLPFDTDDLSVQALDEGRVAIVIGRALVNLKPGEAAALADSLSRAAIVADHQHIGVVPTQPPYEIRKLPPYSPAELMDIAVAATSDRGPLVTDAMVDRAVDAWEQWWNGYANLGTADDANRQCLKHVLQQVLGVAS